MMYNINAKNLEEKQFSYRLFQGNLQEPLAESVTKLFFYVSKTRTIIKNYQEFQGFTF